MKDEHLIDDGYILLAIAVVQQAVADYKRDYKKYLKTGYKSQELKDIERWMTRGEGIHFSFGLGKYILRRVREELEEKHAQFLKNDVYTPDRRCRRIEYNGKTQSLKEWADEYGLHYQTIGMRLARGWSFEKALTTKPWEEKNGRPIQGQKKDI